MTHEHNFSIELIKITPMNINAEDFRDIEQTISKFVLGPIKAETEIEVFKKFSAAMEHSFQAQISTFNPPSEDFKHWMLYLPKDGNFDATPSWFSISFDIKRTDPYK